MTEIVDFYGEFSLGNFLNKIIHSDCLEVMRAMPDKCIDVVITSPPYNLLTSSGNGLKKNTTVGKWKNAAIKNGYEEHDDNMPYAEYIAWQRECVAEESIKSRIEELERRGEQIENFDDL